MDLVLWYQSSTIPVRPHVSFPILGQNVMAWIWSGWRWKCCHLPGSPWKQSKCDFFLLFLRIIKALKLWSDVLFFLSKDVIEYISKKTAGYFAFIIASFLGKHCSKNSNVRQFTKWILRKIYHKDLLLKHPSVTVFLVMRCNW